MTVSEPRITFVSVGWASAKDADMTISLALMRKHCRAERVQDLLEDLALLCEDVEARRRPEAKGRTLSLVPEP